LWNILVKTPYCGINDVAFSLIPPFAHPKPRSRPKPKPKSSQNPHISVVFLTIPNG